MGGHPACLLSAGAIHPLQEDILPLNQQASVSMRLQALHDVAYIALQNIGTRKYGNLPQQFGRPLSARVSSPPCIAAPHNACETCYINSQAWRHYDLLEQDSTMRWTIDDRHLARNLSLLSRENNTASNWSTSETSPGTIGPLRGLQVKLLAEFCYRPGVPH